MNYWNLSTISSWKKSLFACKNHLFLPKLKFQLITYTKMKLSQLHLIIHIQNVTFQQARLHCFRSFRNLERTRFTDVTYYVISPQSAFALTSHGSSPYLESCRMNDQNLCLVLRIGWARKNEVQYLPKPPSLHPFLWPRLLFSPLLVKLPFPNVSCTCLIPCK